LTQFADTQDLDHEWRQRVELQLLDLNNAVPALEWSAATSTPVNADHRRSQEPHSPVPNSAAVTDLPIATRTRQALGLLLERPPTQPQTTAAMFQTGLISATNLRQICGKLPQKHPRAAARRQAQLNAID